MVKKVDGRVAGVPVATENPRAKANLCGHANMHSGALNLTCTLPAGHNADPDAPGYVELHSAPYKHLLQDGETEVDAVCSWSDAAAVPPPDPKKEPGIRRAAKRPPPLEEQLEV